MLGKVAREGFPGEKILQLSYERVNRVGKDIPRKGNSKSTEAN